MLCKSFQVNSSQQKDGGVRMESGQKRTKGSELVSLTLLVLVYTMSQMTRTSLWANISLKWRRPNLWATKTFWKYHPGIFNDL